MDSHLPSLSVVAPCFNEEHVLPEFIRRVQSVCEQLGCTYEIVLVDDGSKDRSWDIIASTSSKDSRILGVSLRRNYGHQMALSAGISAATGSLILLIDSDLQDPPEHLPAMIELMKATDADVVYGQRSRRPGETLFKRLSASAFYRFIDWLSDIRIPKDTGDFRLITRNVADILSQMPEQHRFIRGMVAWIGGRQVPYVYDRMERYAGVTKYPLRRMIRFATDAITSFSRRPLQFATSLGVGAFLISLGFAAYSIISWALGRSVPGWTSLMTVVGLLSAFQFFLLGVLGEYIGRLYEESRGRPLFIEAARVGEGLMQIRSRQLDPSIARRSISK
jgi:polyisoprenyl-phosphate glycosyltransferase